MTTIIDDERVLKAAKLMIRQGIGHTAFEVPDNATPEEIAIARIVHEKVLELEGSGYEPQPMPPLGLPTYLPDATLEFLATNEALKQRALRAEASQAFEDWTFFNADGEDETVYGWVISTKPVDTMLVFQLEIVEQE